MTKKELWQKSYDCKYTVLLLQSLLDSHKEKYNKYKELVKGLDQTKDAVVNLSVVEQIVRKNCYKSYKELKQYYYQEIQNTKEVLAHAKKEWHEANKAYRNRNNENCK